MLLKDFRRNTINDLIQAGIDCYEAEAEVDILLFELFQINKKQLILEPEIKLPSHLLAKCNELKHKRITERTPIQYLLGFTYFYGLKFIVNKNVLIPRRDTELIVELTKQNLDLNKNNVIADIGTGSGCIAISLLKYIKNLKVITTDISIEALEVAKQNAELNNVIDRIEFYHTHILAGITTNFDAIISNPPYVLEKEKNTLAPEVLNWEPSIALFVKDNDPLEYYKKISTQALKQLNPGGFLCVEINPKEVNNLITLLKSDRWKNIQVQKDLNDQHRCILAYLN